MEFEKLYLKLFLPSVRHGASGARKRYAGLIDGHPDVEFTGMEVVRRDWTELAKEVQRELYKRLFAGEPVEDYLEQVAKALRSGELDDRLVYRKGLRKNPAKYTANTPPHVAAARKSSDPGRVISYLITIAGTGTLGRVAPRTGPGTLPRQASAPGRGTGSRGIGPRLRPGDRRRQADDDVLIGRWPFGALAYRLRIICTEHTGGGACTVLGKWRMCRSRNRHLRTRPVRRRMRE